jgi:hypothetical protein
MEVYLLLYDAAIPNSDEPKLDQSGCIESEIVDIPRSRPFKTLFACVISDLVGLEGEYRNSPIQTHARYEQKKIRIAV